MAPTERLRPARLDKGHIPQAMVLSREAGWNQIAADWEMFVAQGKVFGMFDGDALVGTAAVMPYDTHAAWIGMVLVRISHRRRGIGKRMLDICLEEIRGQGRTAYLDATPAGQALYETLGFEGEFPITRWEADLGGGAARGVRAGAPGALPPDAIARIVALDDAAMGMRREALMTSLSARVPGIARLTPDGDAFVLARDGDRALQIGPLVSQTEAEAARLLDSALAQVEGPVFIDVVDGNARIEETLAQRGFAIQRPFLRMRSGPRLRAGDAGRLFAISGPEFG